MARYSRFPSRFSLLRTVVFLTGCSLGLSQAVLAQSVKSAPSQSPQTAASSGSTVQAPATPKPNALTTFLVAPTVAVSGSPSSVAVGDLNGDGNLDLIVANFDAGKISVLLGQGNGQFAAPVDYAVGKQPAFVLIGDVNGDGKLDVVVCNEADGTLSVLLGNGDGTLQNPATYPSVPDPVYVVMGDLNGDGKPDLAVAGNASKTIAVLLNDGTGNFSKAVPYNIGRSPRSLAVADFDGDGHPDLASANADGTVSILLSRGDGSFRAILSLNVASVPLSSVVSGDFNGDGKADLAVTQAGTKLLTVLLGRGDGTFQPGSSYTVGSNPASAVVVDVNNDNIPDLVTANQAGNTFSVLLGNGDGTFKPSLDFTAGNSPRALAAGDFNGDGRADLAIVNFADHTISVPLGNGDGTFQAARAYNVDLDRKSVAAGDLDGDGKPDLVVTNFCGTDATCASNGTVSVLLAVGDGTYKFAASYPLGVGPLSVALADVNADKKLDLIAVNRGDKTVSVLLGNGDGTFQSALTYPAGNSPVSVAVGDFTKDGKPDLAIAGDCGSSTCSQPGEVSILLGNGDGSFQSAATYAVGYSPSSIFAGDVNGDGNLDLVVANACGKDSSCQSNGTATILIGDGKGGFISAGDVKLGTSPSAVTLGDLNGDGAPDLVAAYRADNKVGVLLGNGDGTFKPQVTYQVGTAPSAVVVADFNGDGKRDVAVANFKDSKVSVLFGNGDGTLQPAVHYPVGVGPESLIAIDPNNSGHADLVSANGNGGLTPQGSDVTVLRNLAAPALLTPVFTNLTPSPTITYGTASVTLGGRLCAGPSCVPQGEQVTITIQGQPPQTAMISDNTGDFSTSYPTNTIPVGTYTITYSYAGDMMFNPASDSSTTLTVNMATTTTTITPTPPSPSSYLQPVTLNVTVTGQNGGTPTGTVTFTDNGNPIPECPNPVALVNGMASCTTTSLPVGSDTIAASYSGDSNFQASSSMLTYQVNMATTTTVVTAVPPSPSSYNQDIMFTATVTGANGGSPTGTVSFTSDGNPIPNCTGLPLISMKNGTGKQGSLKKGSPQGNGSAATCDVPTGLPVGQHTIQATYSGDSNYQGSFGTLPYQVNMATTTIMITVVPPAPSSYLQPVMISATVIGQFGGTPTGTVTFTDNGNPIPECPNPVPLVNAGASCTTTSLPVGANVLGVSYSGDNNFQMSSAMLPYQVNQATTTTVVTAMPPSPSSYNEEIMFTATVMGRFGGNPTGTVDFTADGGPIPNCTGLPLISLKNGIGKQARSKKGSPQGNGSAATCDVPTGLPVGQHTIQATYNGDNNYQGSSGMLPYQVNMATTTTVVTAMPPSPSSYNEDIMFTATVTGQFGGNPTGMVDFTADGTPIPNCMGLPLMSLKNGTGKQGISKKGIQQGGGSAATCDVPTGLPVGQHTIQATYNGDNNYQGSSGMLPYQVNMATTTTVVTAVPPSPSSYLQDIMFTATVTGQFGGNPTGTVDFTADGAPIPNCMGLPLMSMKNGTGKQGISRKGIQQGNGSAATCDVPTGLPVGQHTIQATYNGDSNYQGSSGMLPYQVNMATTTTVVTAVPPSPSSYLQDIMFTATVTGQFGGSPTGTVDFTSDGTPIPNCTGLMLMPLKNGTGKQGSSKKGAPQGNGSAVTCDVPTGLAVGSHTVQATYNGDSNYQGSFGTLPYTVNMAMTTTVVTAVPPSPSSYNQDIMFTATVTGAFGGSPTGTVDFTSDGTPIPNCTRLMLMPLKNGTGKQGSSKKGAPQGNGSAVTCDVPMGLPVGMHTIQATYHGDSNYQGSFGTLPYQVNMATTTTTITPAPPSPSSYLQPVTLNVTVAGQFGGTPTGTVTFTDNGNPIPECPNPVALVNAQASCPNITSLPVGSDTIKVSYSGDGNFQMSSATLPYQVNMAATTTAATAVPSSPSSYNQDIKFTATISGAFGGSPTGTVSFTSDGTPIANCTGLPLMSLKNGTGKQGRSQKGSPQGKGSAVTCDVPTGLPVGAHTIQANYSGDSNFSGSNSSIPYTVVKANTTTAAVISPTPTSVLGQQVVVTATVTGAFGGSATGNISFIYGNNVQIPDCPNPAPVSNNQATCATRMLPFGQQTVSATYNGDGNFNPSTPGTAPQTVQDFVIAAQPSSATVIQSYTNTNEPFYAQALATTLMPRGTFGYNGTVNLTCTVTGLTCMVLNDCSGSNANICISPASFVMGNGNATMAVSTAAGTPIGTYMVTITGQDVADGGTPNVAALSVTVVNNSTTVTVVPGFTGTTIANFVGTQSVNLTAFACTEITGTGLPAGGSDPITIGISCTFNPETGTLSTDPTHPTPITVTVLTKASGSTTTRRQTRERILAALWLGMPGIVLIGSLRLRNLSRKRILQILGTLLLLIVLMQGVGCGGGFTPPPSPITPAGAYNLLVVGYSNGTPVTSAVVPVIVTH